MDLKYLNSLYELWVTAFAATPTVDHVDVNSPSQFENLCFIIFISSEEMTGNEILHSEMENNITKCCGLWFAP